MVEKVKPDQTDFKILEMLLDDSRMKIKDIGKTLNLDERMVSRRIEWMIKEGVIKQFTIEIDWSKLGFDVTAYSSTTPFVSEEGMRTKLYEFFNKHPRIVSVDSTVGAYEYVLYTICEDLQKFRERISIPLETMNVGLSTSIVSDHIKYNDLKPLLRVAAEAASKASPKHKSKQTSNR